MFVNLRYHEEMQIIMFIGIIIVRGENMLGKWTKVDMIGDALEHVQPFLHIRPE